MFLTAFLLLQTVSATPPPPPPKDPRPIPARRLEEFPGNYVLHYREWKTYGSIALVVNFRPELDADSGRVSVSGSVDTERGWRWLKDHRFGCVADGARFDFDEEYDGSVEDGYLSERVTAEISRDALRTIAKAEKTECFVGGTQIDTWPARRADLLRDTEKR